ncbi:multiple epidermal growth factor-like domains protein 10 isoform X2 [Mercenaria mercenaria]|uniref:multiple epidermal growth factor-like domains protein 10 isoform X2 n=1 Tax=Mercenaria mercenaria TaxID=6596 RepID=UPI00234F4017|nr:multiple epidermal growth factor-like domains protein 10 isoform X2 [Mercenaria mercenaria]
MMLVLSLSFLCLLFVQVKAQPCEPHHHCLTCRGAPYNCATCPKGYYLTREGGPFHACRECPPLCEECENYSLCTACYMKNHYGKDCKSVCSKGCFNSTCNQLAGTCLCKDNYEGGHCDYCAKGKYEFDTNCTKDCPANCYTCNSDKYCTECNDGYYGNTCELSCSRGCYLGKCSQSNGTCYKNKCKSTFDGINCDQCSAGRFGNDCLSLCPTNCISCTGGTNCDQCKDGYWGDSCQHNCSYGCSTSVCLKTSGICQDRKCRTGFVGEKCDRCTSGRNGLNCNMSEKVFGKDSSANAIHFQACLLVVALLFCSVDITVQIMTECDPSHNCLTCMGVPHDCKTCPSGYFLARGGAHYTCRACPPQCKECEYYTSCTSCFAKSHYGRDCQSVCSKGCLNSTCDHLSGTCLCKDNYEGGHCDYCAKGKYGYDSNCTMDCPVNCLTCNSDKNCTACKDGYYGNTCELSCFRGCYFGKCSQSSGTCYKNKCKSKFDGINCNKCSLGRFGTDCQTFCPDKCVSCSSRTACDKCKNGHWGVACQHNCSHGCLGGVCLKQSGVCKVNKCRSGFVGERCDRCTSGRYGLNCTMSEIMSGKNSSASKMEFQVCALGLAVVMLFRFIDVSSRHFASLYS